MIKLESLYSPTMENSEYDYTIVASEQKRHKQFDSTRIEVRYLSYHSCFLKPAVNSHLQ